MFCCPLRACRCHDYRRTTLSYRWHHSRLKWLELTQAADFGLHSLTALRFSFLGDFPLTTWPSATIRNPVFRPLLLASSGSRFAVLAVSRRLTPSSAERN